MSPTFDFRCSLWMGIALVALEAGASERAASAMSQRAAFGPPLRPRFG
jgi:hypothetical protein